MEAFGVAFLALLGTVVTAVLVFRSSRDTNKTQAATANRTSTSTEIATVIDAWKAMVDPLRDEVAALRAEVGETRAELEQSRVKHAECERELAAIRLRLDRQGA